ncbi:MAG: hypothetical protein AAGK78_07645 [Planctomycetota bacterium]
MFDDSDPSDRPADDVASEPKRRAAEKLEGLRTHAQLAATFEGPRKYQHALHTALSYEQAREVQQAMAKLEVAKTKAERGPLLPPGEFDAARALLMLPTENGLELGDYHIHRRPGEVMILRWLAGEQVDDFYDRLQAHFDVALDQAREEERSTHAWRGDDDTNAYLDVLEEADEKLADWYLRPIIEKHRLYVLSTVTADEMNIEHLADYLMGVPASEVVGDDQTPTDDFSGDGPSDADKAWFFKLFSLRGKPGKSERMCFFAFLQKVDEEGW